MTADSTEMSPCSRSRTHAQDSVINDKEEYTTCVLRLQGSHAATFNPIFTRSALAHEAVSFDDGAEYTRRFVLLQANYRPDLMVFSIVPSIVRLLHYVVDRR